MRKALALLVGINNYSFGPLRGCVNDAIQLSKVLSRHENGDKNFDCKLLTSDNSSVKAATLKKKVTELFKKESDIALFYFSGHGFEDELGGYLVTPDATKYNEGLEFSFIVNRANQAENIKEVIIIIDCCYSGHLGNVPNMKFETSLLRKGVSILTASSSNEVSIETRGHGVFTKLVIDALKGGAADPFGNVNIANVYNYADKLLGPWQQRPIFKSHINSLNSLRKCKALIHLGDVLQLTSIFKNPSTSFPLSPIYEPSLEPHDADKENIFQLLQKLNKSGIVTPVGEEHMYHAAANTKSCALTPLGKFYWQLVDQERI